MKQSIFGVGHKKITNYSKHNLFIHFLCVTIILIFYSCEKQSGKVNVKAIVKEYYTNSPIDSFRFHFSDERCAYLSFGTFCLKDTTIMSNENGEIDFTTSQCCHSEMVLYEFTDLKRYAKRFDVELQEDSNLDSIESCNGIRISSDQSYDFTITIKPFIQLEINSIDSTFVSYEIPEYNLFDQSIKLNRFQKIYLKKLVDSLEVNFIKSDSSKVKMSTAYNAYKQGSLYISI